MKVPDFILYKLLYGDMYDACWTAFNTIPECLEMTNYRFQAWRLLDSLKERSELGNCTPNELMEVLVRIGLDYQPANPIGVLKQNDLTKSPRPYFSAVLYRDNQPQCIGYDLYCSAFPEAYADIRSYRDAINGIDRSEFTRRLFKRIIDGSIDNLLVGGISFQNIIDAFLNDFLVAQFDIPWGCFALICSEISGKLPYLLRDFNSSIFIHKTSHEWIFSPDAPSGWLADITRDIPLAMNAEEVCRAFHNMILANERELYTEFLVDLGAKPETITIL